MMVITIILAILLILAVCYGIYQKRKTYRMIDRLLDSVLSQEKIVYSDVEEGEYSALVSKIKQIQEVLESRVGSADSEKEQVKSLVSNMSHQLKTPLANLSLYAEILGQGEILPERKAEFSDKMQRQIEKLNWIVESLSKMVKLEQNIDGFEVKDTQIRQASYRKYKQTILMVTHNEAIAQTCDRVIHIEDGQIAAGKRLFPVKGGDGVCYISYNINDNSVHQNTDLVGKTGGQRRCIG